jgi:hypothetical protein
MSDLVLFLDVIPYDAPASLAELRGPASGSMDEPVRCHVRALVGLVSHGLASVVRAEPNGHLIDGLDRAE